MRFPEMKTSFGTVSVIGRCPDGGLLVSLSKEEIAKSPICLLSIDKRIPPNFRGGPCVNFIYYPNKEVNHDQQQEKARVRL